ncbi:disease resistance protein RPV1-like [Eucalyptus grandis]|uniref:disease resistance protein RPV1-like n=1 Tax=Eucalyptus grandis TaxID=71139 RepID=UPI00192F0325|nr:disease resistance protein RPV1-like [Eucalyptus grandis]
MKIKEPSHSEDLLYGASSSSTSPHVDDNGGILVFKDDNELRIGEEIGLELLCSITQSKISIPIISKDYAFSKWCLQELAQMLNCRRSRGQVVLPIFYKVEPSQVQYLRERFGDAINAHKKNLNQMVVKEWEDALKEVSLLKGWESEKIDKGHEAGLVKMIVRRVMSELKRLFQLDVPKQLVGTDDRVEQIMSQIDARFNGTWFIGIYGMGGIGKTTLEKILYNKLSSRFENRSFVANVRETFQRQGTSEIEALHLDYYGKWESYRGEQFNELTNLRFLKVCGVNFTGDFQNLLPQLRWLEWMFCPLDFEMVNFHPKKLVMLNLSTSKITEYWGGWGPFKVATELKVLNLSFCDNLRRTPDLSAFKSLEILNLESCCNLKEIHPSIWYIKTLVSLAVHLCSRLKKLPVRVGRMEESRDLQCYDKLAQLPKSMGSSESLTKLDLSHTRIKELPESIGSMKALKTLNDAECSILDHIPKSIGNLASLSLLNLVECESLREIPDSIGELALLTNLQLEGTSITKLPESIGNLQNLRILDLNKTLVTELPSTIGMLVKLQELRAMRCNNLKGLPSSIGELVSLKELLLYGSGILGLPESISKLSSLRHLGARCCDFLREIPEPPSSLIALHIDFPTPSLPFLSKLTLLEKLSLVDLRPLECLPKLPVRLSKLSIKWSHLSGAERLNLEKAVSEFIRYKSFGRRKATRFKLGDSWGFWCFRIDEATSPDSPEVTSTLASA